MPKPLFVVFGFFTTLSVVTVYQIWTNSIQIKNRWYEPSTAANNTLHEVPTMDMDMGFFQNNRSTDNSQRTRIGELLATLLPNCTARFHTKPLSSFRRLRNTAVVVSFLNYNFITDELIEILLGIYEPAFAEVYFCCKKEGMGHWYSLKKGNETRSRTVFYDERKDNSVYTVTTCPALVMPKLDQSVKSLLFIMDDMVLNVWNLDESEFPVDKVWSFGSTGEVRDVCNKTTPNICDPCPLHGITSVRWDDESPMGPGKKWPHWYKRSQKDVCAARQLMDANENDEVRACGERLTKHFGAGALYGVVLGDTFHLPRSHFYKYAALSNYFDTKSIFLELTIPTIIYCITTPSEFVPLPSRHMNWQYGSRRDKPEYWYSDRGLPYHPIKFAPLLNRIKSRNDRAATRLLCDILTSFETTYTPS